MSVLYAELTPEASRGPKDDPKADAESSSPRDRADRSSHVDPKADAEFTDQALTVVLLSLCKVSGWPI